MVSELLEGLIRAVELIVTFNPIIIEITVRSILVSGIAMLIAASWGAPLGLYIGIKEFPGKTLVKGFFNAMLGIPTVALGLILYLLFSRAGPLGAFHLLYTPYAIMIGQAILITPLMVSFITTAIEAVDPAIADLAKTLGASETQASLAVLKEGFSGVFLALVASFNRGIAELGVALMLGGNIRGVTRVLTTSIALQTTRGEIVLGVALAIILLFIVLVISITINILQRRRE
ncbi:MAG: ABC transporter permease [Candidatus Heimdallarchaeota archaeon]